jgi:predicted dehydrogenase
LRIGVLGAAAITPAALLNPAREVPEVTVAALAARDAGRARAYADRHGIPVVHSGYADLVADPELDAVYVPLPNGLHAQWTLAALAAGKHVLCEKPMTANAAQARQVADAAAASGLVVMEAFHYRYHPLVARVLEILGEGTIGAVRHVRTELCFPLPKFGDIRYQLELAGGATMDAGCYAIHFLRLLGGAEPEVVSAQAKLRSPGVDRYMRAQFRFPSGATGQITASMWSARLVGLSAQVTGDAGNLTVFNYIVPHRFPHRLTVRVAGRTIRERVPGEATYTSQLRAFAGAVLHGGPNLTPASDAVRTMSLIDDVYRAAGLQPRGEPQPDGAPRPDGAS